MLRRKPRWTAEEQGWLDTESFPSSVVRSYGKEKQLKRDAKRLRHLGYSISYQTWDWSNSGRWYVTYKQRRTRLGEHNPHQS